jgi:GNAT superfamily N-acetyltransferase
MRVPPTGRAAIESTQALAPAKSGRKRRSMEGEITRDLGDGLIMRRASRGDAEALAHHTATMLRPRDAELDPENVAWMHDLMSRPHPTFRPEDFLLVAEKRSGRIVSAACWLDQTWTYAGIPFRVGRPEVVATLPEYRNRGLVRALFAEFHRWSAERGQLVQAITGIPYFYRQFGYEMTIPLDAGRSGLRAGIPRLKDGESTAFAVRPATEADLDLIAATYEFGSRRSLVACQRDAALWRYELVGRSPRSSEFREFRVIETRSGEPVGFLVHDARLDWPTFRLLFYELSPGVSWAAVTPTVLSYMVKTGEEFGDRDREWRRWTGLETEFEELSFWLGLEHPAYQFVMGALPRESRPYSWYMRIPDVAAFLELVGPALERRVADSALAGHTGELKLSFYRTGVRLAFDGGRVATVEPWKPSLDDQGSARFPDLTFLHLLFGHRTLAELEYAFTDCGFADDTTRSLLGVLFPRQSSDIWPIA